MGIPRDILGCHRAEWEDFPGDRFTQCWRVSLVNKTGPNKCASDTGGRGRVGRLCLALHLLCSTTGRSNRFWYLCLAGRRTLILPPVAGGPGSCKEWWKQGGAASQRWRVGLIACRPRWLLRGDRTEWTSPDDCPRCLHYYPMSCRSPGGSNWLLHSSLPRFGRVGRKQFGKPSVLAKAEAHGLCRWGHWRPW